MNLLLSSIASFLLFANGTVPAGDACCPCCEPVRCAADGCCDEPCCDDACCADCCETPVEPQSCKTGTSCGGC